MTSLIMQTLDDDKCKFISIFIEILSLKDHNFFDYHHHHCHHHYTGKLCIYEYLYK
jgi:hypothetical protein